MRHTHKNRRAPRGQDFAKVEALQVVCGVGAQQRVAGCRSIQRTSLWASSRASLRKVAAQRVKRSTPFLPPSSSTSAGRRANKPLVTTPTMASSAASIASGSSNNLS